MELASFVLKIKDVLNVHKQAVNNVSQAITRVGKVAVYVNRLCLDVKSAKTETLAHNAQAVGYQ